MSVPSATLTPGFAKAHRNDKCSGFVASALPTWSSAGSQGQPFSVSGMGDLLALFRCVSCRYRFAIGSSPAGLQMGAIGRVFASGEPEMSHDVQQYDRSLYIRVGEAKRCRVHSSLFMPLFSGASHDHPVAVFEVAQAERDVLFPALVDCLVSCLQVCGLLPSQSNKINSILRGRSSCQVCVHVCMRAHMRQYKPPGPPGVHVTVVTCRSSCVRYRVCSSMLLQQTGLHTVDARMHAMAVGLQGPPGASPRAAVDALSAGNSNGGGRQLGRQQSGLRAASLQQPAGSAALPSVSEAGAAADVKEAGEGRLAASGGDRSENNSSESIQTSGAAAGDLPKGLRSFFDCPCLCCRHALMLELLPTRRSASMPLVCARTPFHTFRKRCRCRQAGAGGGGSKAPGGVPRHVARQQPPGSRNPAHADLQVRSRTGTRSLQFACSSLAETHAMFCHCAFTASEPSAPALPYRLGATCTERHPSNSMTQPHALMPKVAPAQVAAAAAQQHGVAVQRRQQRDDGRGGGGGRGARLHPRRQAPLAAAAAGEDHSTREDRSP